MTFGRVCVVCDKTMGNSLNRECYKLGKPEGCFIDVHKKCVEEFDKDKDKYYRKDSEMHFHGKVKA